MSSTQSTKSVQAYRTPVGSASATSPPATGIVSDTVLVPSFIAVRFRRTQLTLRPVTHTQKFSPVPNKRKFVSPEAHYSSSRQQQALAFVRVWKIEFEFAHQQVEPQQGPCQKLLRTVHRRHHSTNKHRSIHQLARLHRVI